MKFKHNKKRNTAFLYESLIRELTKAVVKKDDFLKEKIVKMIKENFKGNSEIAKELRLYKTLEETNGLDLYTAERLVAESRNQYLKLDHKDIFNSQTNLINQVNKEISSEVFSNFVPNYRSLATISQIFNDSIPVKQKVLLERKIVGTLVLENKTNNKSKNMPRMDKLVFKTYVEKFNSKYDGNLLKEQKELLSTFLTSFSDNGLQFKSFINEEIGRLKSEVNTLMELENVKEDTELFRKTSKVLEILESYRSRTIDEGMIKEILKIQSLVQEAKTSDD